MMTVIPIKSDKKLLVMIILHKDNLERVLRHDPALINGAALTQAFPAAGCVHFHDIDFMVCFEEDQAAFETKAVELQKSSGNLINHVARGRTPDVDDGKEIINLTELINRSNGVKH